MPCRNTITQSLIYSLLGGKEISKVCSFSIHTTEGLLKGTSSDGVIDYFERRSSCAVATKKKKSGCTRTKRERGRQDNLGGGAQIGIHCLIVVQSGPSYPIPPPPSACTCSKAQTECKAGRGGVFICVCAQWHGCRGFEIIWLCKEGNSNSWCQTGGVKQKVLKSSHLRKINPKFPPLLVQLARGCLSSPLDREQISATWKQILKSLSYHWKIIHMRHIVLIIWGTETMGHMKTPGPWLTFRVLDVAETSHCSWYYSQHSD